jgi:hypothetical protein
LSVAFDLRSCPSSWLVGNRNVKTGFEGLVLGPLKNQQPETK